MWNHISEFLSTPIGKMKQTKQLPYEVWLQKLQQAKTKLNLVQNEVVELVKIGEQFASPFDSIDSQHI